MTSAPPPTMKTALAGAAGLGASMAFAAPSAIPLTPNASKTVHEGWVLKKRRKKMQGFARRYFSLYPSGILTYSFHPEEAARDSIVLYHAAISTAKGRKDIHIDSNTATFHMKCLTSEDFDQWMNAFRTFVPPEGRPSAQFGAGSWTPKAMRAARGTILVDEMGSTITELEAAIKTIPSETPADTQRSKQRSRSGVSKSDKDAHKERHVFGLFKRSGSNHTIEESAVSDSSSPNGIGDQISPQVQHILPILDMLKSQHAQLAKYMQSVTLIDTSHSNSRALTLSPTAEEGWNRPVSPGQRREVSSIHQSIHAPPSGRTSIASAGSGTPSEWFDARSMVDMGLEEFVLDESPEEPEAEQTPTRGGGFWGLLTGGSEQPQISLDSDSDTDASEDEGEVQHAVTAEETPEPEAEKPIIRRNQLPSPVVGDEGSLFSVFKKNVGKDLATIALPVNFNEPLTLLQRAAEEVEYFDLLTQAAQAADAVDRLALVAAFAVSSYAHTRNRSSRKGFNPMLSETFEDPRMRFVAEKVQHQPLVMAYHAEGEGWSLNATSAGKTKFWGKSLEIIPLGITRLTIGEEEYNWKKPSSFMRNLMVGQKYLEHCGKMTINSATNLTCVIDFKQGGMWGASNAVSGVIQSSNGSVLTRIEGRWDDQLTQAIDKSHLKVLWRMTPFPRNATEYYGFTSFGVTLNEITSDLEGKLPPTDSRYRPDVRALEDGDMDGAEAAKVEVEEKQRDRRRQGKEPLPRWFKEAGGEWTYTGEYWERRDQGWEGINKLW